MKKAYRTTRAAAAAVALIGITQVAAAQSKVDPAIHAYEKTPGISGTLNSIGSDTLNNLMTYWAEAFRKAYPNVNIQIEGKGSSTAPPALIEGTAQLGPMSRKMKHEEVDLFDEKYGFKPTKIGVALDCIGVYVNKDNPIEELSLEEIDAIFSKTRRGGHPADIITWGQAGVKQGAWSGRPISTYGRNSASGTYGYFKKHALFKGDFKDTVKEQPGSASVVLGVTEDRTGLGYSGIGYTSSGVKTVALSKGGGKAYEPTSENTLKGKYPLARMLYVYIVKAPSKPLDPIVKEYMRLILSKEGQEIAVKDGYIPLPASEINKQLSLLD